MSKPRLSGTLVSIAFLLMAACYSHDRPGRDALGTPVDEGQRTLAVDAVNGLRDAFNNGSCQSIYEQAAASFRTQSLPQWMSQCRELNEKLGSWQSFGVSRAVRYGGRRSDVVVYVGGVARFAKESTELKVAWLLKNGHTQLMRISLRQNQGTWVQIPPMQLPPGRFWDPPPPPLPGSGRAG